MIDVILWGDETWLFYDSHWTNTYEKGVLNKYIGVHQVAVKMNNINVALGGKKELSKS